MSLQPKPSLTLDQWIEQERNAIEARCEYVRGEVFAMTGASADHNAIVTNIVREFSTQMKGKPCHVYANDMKVAIRAADAGKYPDILAYCGPPEFADGRRDVLLNPSLIAEVLSPSTEAYDRGDKFALYRQIPSLREYLLVSQDRALVELYERGEGGRWILTEYGALTDVVVLPSIGCSLPLGEIYDKVDLLRT